MATGAAQGPRRCARPGQRSTTTSFGTARAAVLAIIATSPFAMAQNCVSLSGSTLCPAFSSASVSTDAGLVGFFPFLRFVSDTASFDEQLRSYVNTTYVQTKYQTLLGCGDISLTNTTNLYARYTTSVICNALIQNSRTTCGLTDDQARPLCADTCAQQASSEAIIVGDNSLCSNPGPNSDSQIRADFTNCALPANALSGTKCIEGSANEKENCGFGDSTVGLCQYCAAGGQNSTDTCCYNAQAESRCENVALPSISSYMTFPTQSSTSSTSSPTGTTAAAKSSGGGGLSGGAIAGIVVGSIVGAILLAGLIALLFLCCRRRRGSQNGSVFNQPSPPRRTPPMASTQAGAQGAPEGYEVLPGGRIARMSALEAQSNGNRGTAAAAAAAAAGGAVAGYTAGKRRNHDQSSSDEFGSSPNSHHAGGILRPPPTSRRNGSLSSSSALGGEEMSSPQNSGSGGDMSSPQGMASQQSEQLAFFKDYYSQEEIHPGDRVSTLWAYQPRAADEFALERGDMLKIVGIWDDGWATGVLINDRAEEWELKKSTHRDSGVSHTSGRQQDDSPATSGEIKAFPLVCVCLPDHWRRTIEGDGSTETGSSFLMGAL